MLTINADAHPLMNRFHKPGDEKRMPMMLPPQQVQAWLAGALVNAPEAFAPFPAEQLIAIPDPLPARRGNKARTSESDAPQQSGLAFT
jgi:putative SOS response-associated peptidase YedK